MRSRTLELTGSPVPVSYTVTISYRSRWVPGVTRPSIVSVVNATDDSPAASYRNFRRSFMSDLKSSKPKGCFNPVVHERLWLGLTSELSTTGSFSYTITSGDWYITYTVVDYPAACNARAITNDMRSSIQMANWSDPTNLSSVLDSVFFQLLPDTSELSGDTSLLLFLAELRDFKELARTMKAPCQGMRELIRSYSLGPDVTLGEVLKRVGKLSSNARLSLEFAIKPFISDIQALHKAFTNIDARVKVWNDQAERGKTRRVHRKMGSLLDQTCPFTHSQSYTWMGTFGTGHTSMYWGGEVDGVCTLEYKPSLIDTKCLKGVKRYHDAIGAGKILSLAWELVPYSFLVDYVVTLGNYIEQFDESLAMLPIHNVVAGYSLTKECSLRAQVAYAGSLGTSSGSIRKYERRMHRLVDYELMPMRKISSSRVQIKLPSYQQLINVLALVTGLVTRR